MHVIFHDMLRNIPFPVGVTTLLLLPSEENFDSHNQCSFLSERCPRINVFAINFVNFLKLNMTTYFTAPTLILIQIQ